MEADHTRVLRTADGLPRDPVVLPLVGDLAVPLTRAEPDLLAPVDLVVFLLVHVENAVHELRKFLELGPGLVRLLERNPDVGPALDRQAPCLAATLTAPATAAEHLRGGLAGDPAAGGELALRPLDAFAAELLGLVVRLAAEHLHQVRASLCGQPSSRRGSRGRSSWKQDFLACQRRETGAATTAGPILRSVLIDNILCLFIGHRSSASFVGSQPGLPTRVIAKRVARTTLIEITTSGVR